MKMWIILGSSLLIYLAVAGFIASYQADYINADFVAYVTIAHRMISQPALSISAYWSPLYSWMMTPLLVAGIDDLITGRVILILSGAVYLCAIYGLAVSICGSDSRADRLIRIGTMVCGIIQASIWATYLLDPDLLANALLFLYFCLCTNSKMLKSQSLWMLLTGAVAGVCYLAKAYMLPFCLLHFVLTIVIDWCTQEKSTSSARFPWSAIRTVCLFGLGLGIVAGPWIYRLSTSQQHLTFSTAGSSNHANVSPEYFQKDPLWNPGLVADYIFEPRLEPDWSPFQDSAHFLHQARLILHNGSNCVGLIPTWLVLFFLSLSAVGYRGIHLETKELTFLVWTTVTVFVYCAGYTTVNLEARYIIPTVAPLLCLASLIMLRALLVAPPIRIPGQIASVSEVSGGGEHGGTSRLIGEIRRWTDSRSTILVIVFVLLFGAVDIHNLVRIATVHPQSTKRDKFRTIAEDLQSLRVSEDRVACSDWHFGLFVAYAADCLPNYWGAPLSQSGELMIDELELKNVGAFLRLVPDSQIVRNAHLANPFDGRRTWTRLATIRHRELQPQALEVYVRD